MNGSTPTTFLRIGRAGLIAMTALALAKTTAAGKALLDAVTPIVDQVNLGAIKVPDPRIDRLSSMFKPKKTTYAEIVFSDIPGEHGAEHKGLSGKALQQIRDQDVLCLVLRAFPNPALEDDVAAASDVALQVPDIAGSRR